MNLTKNNYDDVFLRDLTICTLASFEETMQWTNRFESGDIDVIVPVYYSMTGSEDFLLDSFTDDIVSNVRKLELNSDIIPRGHITLNSWSIKSDEFCNPNVWLKVVVENEIEIKKELTKLRAIPIRANYSLNVKLESELDVMKCSESLMKSIYFYKYMYFEHNFMHIDAILTMPDDCEVTIQREKNFGLDNTISLKLDFNVDTFYPSYNNNQKIGKPKGVNWINQLKSAKKQI